jgi:hypothetical protein
MNAPSDARDAIAHTDPELRRPQPPPGEDPSPANEWPADEADRPERESFLTILLRALSAWPN